MEFQLILASLAGHLKRWPEVSLAFLGFFFLRWYLKHQNQVIVNWPFFGKLPSLLWNANRITEWTTEVFNSLGTGSFYIEGPIFSTPMYLCTCHPRNLEYILKTNFSNFPKGPDLKEIFDILGDGILNADTESWKAQKKMAHSLLNSVEARRLVANTSRRVVEDKLVPLLAHAARQGSSIDLQDVFSRFAFDSTMSIIFGKDEGHLSVGFPANEFAKSFDVGQEVTHCRHAMPFFVWKLLRWLRVGKERKLAKAWTTIDLFIAEYISLKREDLSRGVKTTDLLSLSMKAIEKKNVTTLSKSSDKFLRDTVLNLFAAGRDTVTSGLVWFFWLVSRTPLVEAKILEELKLVYSSKKKNEIQDENGLGTKHPWVFDSNDLTGLVYLHAAFCESLRLYPPLPLNSKGVGREDVLPDGTTVKPGMQIILSFYAAGRMPWIWGEDCSEFRPERWIDDDGKLSHEPMSKFFAFNTGPRTCLGKDVVFTEMKSVAAAILFNFHVEVVEGHRVSIKPYINLYMGNGLMVNIKERAVGC